MDMCLNYDVFYISEEHLKDRVNMGINVRSDKKNKISYADHIVDGKKTMETRNSHTLKPYVGRRMAIIKTGEGKAHAIGEVTVGEPIEVDEEEFRKREHEHLVPKGSQYDIKPGGKKHLYPMHDPVRYDQPREVARYGIIGRKVL